MGEINQVSELTMQTERTKLVSDTLQKRRFNEVTVGIVVACKDGVVIGADRKVTRSRGTRIKSLEDKVHKLLFRDGRSLLICYSGSGDFAERAIAEIAPSAFDADCSFYRDVIESRISRLQQRLADRGVNYDATLLFSAIDLNGKPTIGHVTPSGVTELKTQGYFTTGIAAPYAEIVLKDSYSRQITIEDAKLIVGGLIEKIGTVDNDVEGMDTFSLSAKDKQVKELSWAERQGIKTQPLSFDFKEELDDLRREIRHWQEFEARMEKKAIRQSLKKAKKTEGEGKVKQKN
jgi:20S proteasome alpha/beta subunit